MAKGPKKYDIVTSSQRPEDLVALVRSQISKGWEPIGGVVVGVDGLLMQAMTKEGETLYDPR